jgi:inorganic triphosphatase YgiF
MAQEIEIKLAARPDDLARLKRSPALKRFGAGPAATERLNTVYYDTPGLGLSKAGLSLRVRKKGRAYIQTLKTQGTGALNVKRGEWECPLPSAIPNLRLIADEGLRQQVEAIAAKEPFEPKIETAIRRTKRRLKTEAGDEIEFAVDSGEIRTLVNGRTSVPVSEVELELLKGSPSGLFDVARALADETPLTVSVESKAERGLRALEGRDVSAHKAGQLVLASDATAEEAFRATLLHCLRHIARNVPAVVEARDPEGVHQVRVGLRRLRAALTVFGDAFRVAALEPLREKARKLTNALATTRDLDVFATELLVQVEKNSADEPGLIAFRRLLDEERAKHWDEAVASVSSDEFTGFLIDLAAAAEARVWREGAEPQRLLEMIEPASALAHRALDKRLAKAKKLTKHMETLSPDDRHKLRIQLKKLRYSAEFFAPLFDHKKAALFLRQLSDLQDIFGAMNDAEMAGKIAERLLKMGGADEREDLRAAKGLIMGWHMGRADFNWKKAMKRWKQFSKRRPSGNAPLKPKAQPSPAPARDRTAVASRAPRAKSRARKGRLQARG